jgi:hypothetical protein
VIRAVLDTSVLVPPSTRKELQLAATDGRFVALWSPWIIAELNRVLTWLWIEASGGDLSLANQQRCSQAAKTMMRILASTFVVIDVHPPLPQAWDSLTDADDVPIWATVLASAALPCRPSRRAHDMR